MVGRRLPGQGANGPGRNQVFGRQVVGLGDAGDDFPTGAEPGGGPGVLVGPRPQRRWPVETLADGGELLFVESHRLLDGVVPLTDETTGSAVAHRAQTLERGEVLGHRLGNLEDGGVGQDAARGDVPVGRDRVAGFPQGPHDAEGATSAGFVDAGRAAPWFLAGRRSGERKQRLELLGGPFTFAGLDELGVEDVAQLHEDFDVKGGVMQPRIGQRPGGPVGGGMLLGEAALELALDECGQADAGQVEQPTGELGVEQRLRPHLDLGKTHQVLGRGVQDPFGAADGVVELAEVVEGNGIDQRGAAALAADLHEIGPLGVAIARCTFGVERHRPGAGRDRFAYLVDRLLGLDDWCQGLAELESG